MIIPWKNVTPLNRDRFYRFEQRIIEEKFVKDAEEAADALLYFVACHQYAYKLDFEKLKKIDKFTFLHDYYGLQRHLDKKTGKIGDCFLPRCSKNGQ